MLPLAPLGPGRGLVGGEQGLGGAFDRVGFPGQAGVGDAEGERGGVGAEVVLRGREQAPARRVRILAHDEHGAGLSDEGDRSLSAE